MDEVAELSSKMSEHISPESGLLVLGVAIAFLVLFAVAAQYFEFLSSASSTKFSPKPYVKFAYVSFVKPHTGEVGGGQQSALESFYSAQVGNVNFAN